MQKSVRKEASGELKASDFRGMLPFDERRRELNERLIARSKGGMTAISGEDRELFAKAFASERVKTYGNSWYYVTQAVNGNGEFNLGLKFFDGETLATVGAFERPAGGGLHFHVVRPMGERVVGTVADLAKFLREESGNPVFVKKISMQQKAELVARGFVPVEDYVWHPQAPKEDDSFPERIANVREVVERVNGRGTSFDLRDKVRRFMKQSYSRIRSEQLASRHVHEFMEILLVFFISLKAKGLHLSVEDDYFNMLDFPPLGENEREYLARIFYLGRKPAAFYCTEKCGEKELGAYANIALRPKGRNRWLSEFINFHLLQQACELGIEKVNFGGSETKGLDEFKKNKLLATETNQMEWAVWRG